MTAKEVLIAARALIADPARWCRGAPGRDRHNASTGPWEPHTEKWCSLGATAKVIDIRVGHPPELYEARAILRSAIGNQSVSTWNDSNDHATIIAGFDRAINS